MKLLLAVLALTASMSSAHAAPALEDLSSEELLTECRKAEPEFCRGYIQAVAEGIFTRGTTVCIDPATTSREDLLDAVVTWIANYSGAPDELTVYRTIETLYPCTEN